MTGEMADLHLDSEPEDGPLYSFGGTLSFRCCGQADLHWEECPDSGKWRLFHGNRRIHNCPVNPLRNTKDEV